MRLAPYATVIVSTRELRRGGTKPSLLDVLTAGTAELDLDDPAAQQRGRGDMRAYIAGRLAGVDPAMDPDAVAGQLAAGTSMTGGSPFLLARLVTDQLRASPVDTSQPGWQDRVSHSIEDAFDADLAQVRAPGGIGAGPAGRADLGIRRGTTRSGGRSCASALGGGGLGRDDVTGVLDELGRYIIQDGEAGVAVYRIAHQTLAEAESARPLRRQPPAGLRSAGSAGCRGAAGPVRGAAGQRGAGHRSGLPVAVCLAACRRRGLAPGST